jgi:hypothetical protein
MTEGGEMEMLYHYTASGSVAVIERWIQDNMVASPEEVATSSPRPAPTASMHS